MVMLTSSPMTNPPADGFSPNVRNHRVPDSAERGRMRETKLSVGWPFII